VDLSRIITFRCEHSIHWVCAQGGYKSSSRQLCSRTPPWLAQILFKMGSPYYGPDESSYDIFLERTFLAGDLLSGVGYGEYCYGTSENLTHSRIQAFNWFCTHHVHYFCGMCANRGGDNRCSFLDTLPFSWSSRPSSLPYNLAQYRLSTSTIGITPVVHGLIFLRHSTFPSMSCFMPLFLF
jgi:hypothetical protein